MYAAVENFGLNLPDSLRDATEGQTGILVPITLTRNSDTDAIAGLVVKMTYNPLVVRPVNVQFGSLLNSRVDLWNNFPGELEDDSVIYYADDSIGELKFIIFDTSAYWDADSASGDADGNPLTNVDGDGEIALVTFDAMGVGNSTIAIDGSFDDDGSGSLAHLALLDGAAVPPIYDVVGYSVLDDSVSIRVDPVGGITIDLTPIPGNEGQVQGDITVDTPGPYTLGQTVDVTAAPATNCFLSSWGGDASGTGLTTSITLDADPSVTANFFHYGDVNNVDDGPRAREGVGSGDLALILRYVFGDDSVLPTPEQVRQAEVNGQSDPRGNNGIGSGDLSLILQYILGDNDDIDPGN